MLDDMEEEEEEEEEGLELELEPTTQYYNKSNASHFALSVGWMLLLQSMHITAYHCILLHITAYCCISLHIAAYRCISLHITAESTLKSTFHSQ